jgi:ribosomal protein S27E
MLDPRSIDEDGRLQRLADLSIEIRMLKARVQSVMDARAPGESPALTEENLNAFRSVMLGARCPHCGHTAGLALLPREYHRPSMLVRCFSCRRDAVAFDWVGTGLSIGT